MPKYRGTAYWEPPTWRPPSPLDGYGRRVCEDVCTCRMEFETWNAADIRAQYPEAEVTFGPITETKEHS